MQSFYKANVRVFSVRVNLSTPTGHGMQMAAWLSVCTAYYSTRNKSKTIVPKITKFGTTRDGFEEPWADIDFGSKRSADKLTRLDSLWLLVYA